MFVLRELMTSNFLIKTQHKNSDKQTDKRQRHKENDRQMEENDCQTADAQIYKNTEKLLYL